MLIFLKIVQRWYASLVYVLDNTARVMMEYFSSFAKVSFGSSIMVE